MEIWCVLDKLTKDISCQFSPVRQVLEAQKVDLERLWPVTVVLCCMTLSVALHFRMRFKVMNLERLCVCAVFQHANKYRLPPDSADPALGEPLISCALNCGALRPCMASQGCLVQCVCVCVCVCVCMFSLHCGHACPVGAGIQHWGTQ